MHEPAVLGASGGGVNPPPSTPHSIHLTQVGPGPGAQTRLGPLHRALPLPVIQRLRWKVLGAALPPQQSWVARAPAKTLPAAICFISTSLRKKTGLSHFSGSVGVLLKERVAQIKWWVFLFFFSFSIFFFVKPVVIVSEKWQH